MIMPIRELVNILYTSTLDLQNNQPQLFTCYSINIEIDMFKEHSTFPSLNSSREMSIHSAVSSMNYAD